MIWSFPIGRILGSELRIHVTFVALLVWIAATHFRQGGADAALAGLLSVALIFACVIAHEYGHALAARRYGIRTPDITLLPIGGVARLERMPDRPGEEIVVALAGPAVNLAIAAVLTLGLGAGADTEALARMDDPRVDLVRRLAAINWALALFNLVPAFPMDGGRVLRALLATRMGRARATRIAARVGQALSFVLGFLGLFGSPLLVFVAIFVFLAATAEARSVEMGDLTRALTLGDAIVTRFETLRPQQTVAHAAEALIRTTQHEFPVVDGGGRLRGVLTREAMVKALGRDGAETPVMVAMDPDIPCLSPDARLDDALTKMAERPRCPAVAAVAADGRLVGYLTRDNLAELMMVREVRRGGRQPTSSPARGPLLPQ